MQDTFSICSSQEKQDKVLIFKIWACSELKILTVAAAVSLSGAMAYYGCSLAASWPLVSDFETEDWLNFQKVHLRNCFPP